MKIIREFFISSLPNLRGGLGPATRGRRRGGGAAARRWRGKSVRAGDGSLASQANENDERREKEKRKDGAKTPKRATLQKVLQPN